MAKKRKTGEKFTDRYGTESATIYKGDVEALQIPGPAHPLYDPTAPTTFDPIRVEAIDRDGKMTTPIEVWTDPDEGILWVLDGRGRLLDVREVNRRRRAEGREPVKPYIVPFSGDERAAIARVREKNYHRRTPTLSATAVDLLALRRAGYPWDACAKILHVETADAEQWGRKLFPLAYCVDEVRAAIDAGRIPRSSARKFGGAAADGSEALGRREQIALLGRMLEEKSAPTSKQRTLTPRARARVRDAVSIDRLRREMAPVADVVAATLARVDGDETALRHWPEIAAIVEQALAGGTTPSETGAPDARQSAGAAA